MKQLLWFLSIVFIHYSSSVTADGDISRGEKLAGQCTACHGTGGNSTAPVFPKLAGQNTRYFINQLNDMAIPHAQGGRPVPEMSAFLISLTPKDKADLAAYYAKQPVQGGTAKADLVKRGELLYRGGDKAKQISACTGCHGPAGKGNRGAGFPALAGQHAAYVEKQLKAFRLGDDQPNVPGARVNDGKTRMMRMVSAPMSDLDIKALASYIEGLR